MADLFSNLPKELVIEQALRLSNKDVLALANTSVRLNAIVALDDFWRQKFIHDNGPVAWRDSCLSIDIDSKLEAIVETNDDARAPDIELAFQLGKLNRVFTSLKILDHPIEQTAILTGYANSKYKTKDGLIKILKYMQMIEDLRDASDEDAPIFYQNRGDHSCERYWLTNIESDDDIVTIIQYFIDNGNRDVVFDKADIPANRYELITDLLNQ